MPSEPAPVADRPESLVGGLASSRRMIRRRGGVMGIAVAIGLWITGLVIGAVFSGAKGGALSFLFVVMAFPVMPLLGIPAAGGAARVVTAVLVSAAVWWVIGQVTAARVTNHPVVGWREWSREFVALAIGLWIGAVGGLAVAALALGAL